MGAREADDQPRVVTDPVNRLVQYVHHGLRNAFPKEISIPAAHSISAFSKKGELERMMIILHLGAGR